MLYDVLVVGSGIAGLRAALKAKQRGAHVALIIKGMNPLKTNSSMASGGINAALGNEEEDSVLEHVVDTKKGGAGLVDSKSVMNLCSNAGKAIRDFELVGVPFDTNGEKIAQRSFGGNGKKRTCYIADRTGPALVQKLFAECRKAGVILLNNHYMLSIIVEEKEIAGVTVLRQIDSVVTAIACKSLVLASGGFAGIYSHTTNPKETCGDGIAAALRAGIKLKNMEFVQFHPTTLKKSGSLLSEAARGEGGYLVNSKGERFTNELDTRDKVSRAILCEIEKGEEVFLDVRHLGEEKINSKIPSVRRLCINAAGLDPLTDLIPIYPSAHYSVGGIAAKSDTSTSVKGLFVCGEAACNGVHGANRLGGNSLLDGAVFGKVAGDAAYIYSVKSDYRKIDFVKVYKDSEKVERLFRGENRYNVNALKKSLGNTLDEFVAVKRDEKGLQKALDYVRYLKGISIGLNCINKDRKGNTEVVTILEFKNSLTVAEALIVAALKRKESRGVHFRNDFPKEEKDLEKNSYLYEASKGLYKVDFIDESWSSIFSKIKRFLINN